MILFAGDSFSHYDDQETWVNVFCQKLDKDYKNVSLEGSSFWYTFNKIRDNNEDLLKNKFEYTVITCTSPQRIPFCKEPSKAYYSGSLEPITDSIEDISVDFLHFGYYQRFYDYTLHKFVYERCLGDLVYQLQNHTKIILLGCMPDSLRIIKEVYKQNSNFIFLDNFTLSKIAKQDTIDKKYKNHFDKETNITFGEMLADIVKQNNSGSFDLDLKNLKRR
jgi:hypothetical protein